MAIARRAYVDAKAARHIDGKAQLPAPPNNPGTMDREHELPIWQAMLNTLQAYHHPNNTNEEFPKELAFDLAEAIADIRLVAKVCGLI